MSQDPTLPRWYQITQAREFPWGGALSSGFASFPTVLPWRLFPGLLWHSPDCNLNWNSWQTDRQTADRLTHRHEAKRKKAAGAISVDRSPFTLCINMVPISVPLLEWVRSEGHALGILCINPSLQGKGEIIHNLKVIIMCYEGTQQHVTQKEGGGQAVYF